MAQLASIQATEERIEMPSDLNASSSGGEDPINGVGGEPIEASGFENEVPEEPFEDEEAS
jgi:hypothetical protein